MNGDAGNSDFDFSPTEISIDRNIVLVVKRTIELDRYVLQETFQDFKALKKYSVWKTLKTDSTGEAVSVLQAVEHDHVKTGKALTANNNTFALPAAA